MDITIDWGNKIIHIPRASMTLIQESPTEIRGMEINDFRMALKDLEDSEEGMPFPDTHRHNTEVTVGGVTLARVVEIINDYTITFEDGQYAVNLSGANSNIGDRVNVNQVSVRSANSAGMTSSPAIEFGSFNGGVTVDTSGINVGTVYPVGTPLRPVNNFADALLIATARGFDTIYIIGNATIDTDGIYDNMKFIGQSLNQSTFTISEGASVIGCHFYNATIQGILDGNSTLKNCKIGTLDYVSGHVENCFLTEGTITLIGNASFMSCYGTNYDSSNPPVIDLNGSGTDLIVRDYNGSIKIKNKSGDEEISIDLNSGRLIVDSTVTNGVVTVRGIGALLDYSTGDTVINSNELVSKATVTEAVWDAPLVNYMQESSTGRVLSTLRYEGAVFIDQINGISGTTYPTGSRFHPVNNFSDARLIAIAQGIDEFVIKGSISADDDFTSCKIRGYQDVVIYSEGGNVFNVNGKTFANVMFENIEVVGSMNPVSAGLQFLACYLKNVSGVSGDMTQCSLGENIAIVPGSYFSGVELISEGDETTIDLGGQAYSIISFDVNSGYLLFKNCVTDCLIELNLRGGEIEFDASCTGGEFYAEGYGTVLNPEALENFVVSANHLIALETIPGPIWDSELSDYQVPDTFGYIIGTNLDEKISEVKMVAIGAALNKRADSCVINSGTVISGTYLDTYDLNQIYHQIQPVDGIIDVDYTFELGSNNVGVSMTEIGRLAGNVTGTIFAYRWEDATFYPVGVLTGKNEDTLDSVVLFLNNTGIDDNEGKVIIKFYADDLGSTNYLMIDMMWVSYSALSAVSSTDIENAVWNATTTNHKATGTFGLFIQKLLTVAKFLGLK